jgi:hypothetical protein
MDPVHNTLTLLSGSGWYWLADWWSVHRFDQGPTTDNERFKLITSSWLILSIKSSCLSSLLSVLQGPKRATVSMHLRHCRNHAQIH